VYTQRIVHVPALGKSAELRAALEERNNSPSTVPHALAANMFSPQVAYVHALRFEDLAAIEAYQNRPLDATFQAQGQKINQCLAQERITFLYEQLATTGPLSVRPKFAIRNRQAPAAGKGPELRAMLDERIHTKRPGVAGARLERQIGSIAGPAFTVTLLFGSMADMDTFFAANEADTSFPTYVKKIASLTRTPLQQRIQRIIAPFPAQ